MTRGRKVTLAAAAVALLGLLIAPNVGRTESRSPIANKPKLLGTTTVSSLGAAGRESDQSAAAHGRTLVVFVRNLTGTFIDHPPRNEFSVGDQNVASGVVIRRGKRVGELDALQTITRIKGELFANQDTITVTLPGGQISATGVAGLHDTQFVTEAVTGGTGRFWRARGEVHLDFTNIAKEVLRLTFHLAA